jgi:hypothetical protein
MKIDRHNYEEYFLLYIDNELTVEQMKHVELFVTENPDLEEEFVMLQQSRLIVDDTIVFDDKHLLMKDENDSFINMGNYEEWLVSYVDHEVNDDQRIAIEKFTATHPHVQQELALFQQTKLQPEKIFFADKQVLYKREKARIVSMQWWRVSVAAMLVLAAGIGLFSILSKKASTGGTIAQTETEKITKQQPVSTPNATSSNKKTSAPIGPEQPTIENHSLATTTNDKVVKKSSRKGKIFADKKSNEPRLAVNSTRAHVVTSEQTVVQPVQTKSPEIAKLNENALNEKINTRKIVDNSVTNPTVETPHVMYASNTDNDENKRFRGFFRKASRIIERSTNVNPNANDDRVLIGGMAINLK